MAKNSSDKGGKGEPAAKRFNRGERGTHPLDKDFQPKPEGVVEVLGGDELQTLSVVWRDDFSFFEEGSFWHDLEVILGNCDKVLLRHGWDRNAGNARNFPGDRTAKPFSEFWYAGKIGFECWNLLNWHRVHGPNEIALSQSLYLGRLLSEAEWRAAFKPATVTGKGVRKGAQSGGEGRSGTYMARNFAVIEYMRSLQEAGHSIACSAELAAKKGHGTSKAANRALWYRKRAKNQ